MLAPDLWSDFTLRIFLSLVGGALLGFDRTTRGRPAGMRTTMLVCLAAAGAMMLGHALLSGREESGRFDPLRIAQGVLAGMGFIGAGAIVRREDAVLGVTTAATLWLSTILGLCLGAGAWLLGAGVLAAGVIVLWALDPVENLIHRERQARLRVRVAASGPDEAALRESILAARFTPGCWTIAADRERGVHTHACTVRWKARPQDDQVPGFVRELTRNAGVISVRWEPAV